MRATPGTSRTYPVSNERITVADDLRLAAPIEGEVRLQRTGRSILADADLSTALEGQCSRCLRPTVDPITVTVKEEALPSIDFETGLALDFSQEPDALRIDEHHELDLSQPIRDAISLAEPIAPLCRPDCRGLCVECGADLNADPAHGHAEVDVDPRLAALLDFRAADTDEGGDSRDD